MSFTYNFQNRFRVTDQLAKCKKFWKNFFTKLLERMTGICSNDYGPDVLDIKADSWNNGW